MRYCRAAKPFGHVDHPYMMVVFITAAPDTILGLANRSRDRSAVESAASALGSPPTLDTVSLKGGLKRLHQANAEESVVLSCRAMATRISHE